MDLEQAVRLLRTLRVPDDVGGQVLGEARTVVLDELERLRAREAEPGARRGPRWACTCPGCWACAGRVPGCTCDVDWDALAEARIGRST